MYFVWVSFKLILFFIICSALKILWGKQEMKIFKMNFNLFLFRSQYYFKQNFPSLANTVKPTPHLSLINYYLIFIKHGHFISCGRFLIWMCPCLEFSGYTVKHFCPLQKVLHLKGFAKGWKFDTFFLISEREKVS